MSKLTCLLKYALISLVFIGIASATALAQTYHHMYVFNECASDIDVSATYFPIGKNEQVTSSTTVRSGSQQMVAVSEHNTFLLQPVTTNKTWDVVEFNTNVQEYTHVLSCDCKGPGCPDQWPGPPITRQHVK